MVQISFFLFMRSGNAFHAHSCGDEGCETSELQIDISCAKIYLLNIIFRPLKKPNTIGKLLPVNHSLLEIK